MIIYNVCDIVVYKHTRHSRLNGFTRGPGATVLYLSRYMWIRIIELSESEYCIDVLGRFHCPAQTTVVDYYTYYVIDSQLGPHRGVPIKTSLEVIRATLVAVV